MANELDSMMAMMAGTTPDTDICILPDRLRKFDTRLKERVPFDGIGDLGKDEMRCSALLGMLCSAVGWHFIKHSDALFLSMDDDSAREAIRDAMAFVGEQCGEHINQLQNLD